MLTAADLKAVPKDTTPASRMSRSQSLPDLARALASLKIDDPQPITRPARQRTAWSNDAPERTPEAETPAVESADAKPRDGAMPLETDATAHPSDDTDETGRDNASASRTAGRIIYHRLVSGQHHHLSGSTSSGLHTRRSSGSEQQRSSEATTTRRPTPAEAPQGSVTPRRLVPPAEVQGSSVWSLYNKDGTMRKRYAIPARVVKITALSAVAGAVGLYAAGQASVGAQAMPAAKAAYTALRVGGVVNKVMKPIYYAGKMQACGQAVATAVGTGAIAANLARGAVDNARGIRHDIHASEWKRDYHFVCPRCSGSGRGNKVVNYVTINIVGGCSQCDGRGCVATAAEARRDAA